MRGRPRQLSERFIKEDFKALYKSARGNEKLRYLGLHHIQGGKSYAEVGALLLLTTLAVINWVKKYECKGAPGLQQQKGQGRPARLSIKTPVLQKAITELQEKRKGGRVKGRDILKMIQDKFKVTYTLSGLYELLKRHRMVWITGRSIHPKANPEAQETFKKTSKN